MLFHIWGVISMKRVYLSIFILLMSSINFLSAGKKTRFLPNVLSFQGSNPELQKDSKAKKRKYDDLFEQKNVLNFQQEPQEKPIFKQKKESFSEYYITDSHLRKCLREYGFDLERKWDDIVERYLPFPGFNNQEFSNLFKLRTFNQTFLDALGQLSQEITLFFNDLASKPEQEILEFIRKICNKDALDELFSQDTCTDIELMNIQYLPERLNQNDFNCDEDIDLDDLPIKKWVEIYKIHARLLTPVSILRIIDMLLVKNFLPETLAARLAAGDQTFYSMPLCGFRFAVIESKSHDCQGNHMITSSAVHQELFELESMNDLTVRCLFAKELDLDSAEELPSMWKKLAYFLLCGWLIAPTLSWIPDLLFKNTTHQLDDVVIHQEFTEMPEFVGQNQKQSAQFRKFFAGTLEPKSMKSDFCYDLTTTQEVCCRLDISNNEAVCCTVTPTTHQVRACSSFTLADDSSISSKCNANSFGVITCDEEKALQNQVSSGQDCQISENWVSQRNVQKNSNSSKYDFFKNIFTEFFQSKSSCATMQRITDKRRASETLMQRVFAYTKKILGREELCPKHINWAEVTDSCLAQDSCPVPKDCMEIRFAQSIEEKMPVVSNFLQSKMPNRDHTICFVTLSTPNRASFAEQVESNQVAYAQRHGYDYFKSDKALCSERPEEWSKIIALSQAMEQTTTEWLLWIDDDIVITNPSISLGTLIEKYGVGKNIIIAHDAYKDRGVPINNGIFLIRNCPWSKSFLDMVWQKGQDWGLLTRGKSLLEQETMTRLRARDSDVQEKMVVIEQKEINSFLRCNYYNDPEDSKWQPGDFAAHATGMSEEHRKKVISGLMNQGEFPTQKPHMPC